MNYPIPYNFPISVSIETYNSDISDFDRWKTICNFIDYLNQLYANIFILPIVDGNSYNFEVPNYSRIVFKDNFFQLFTLEEFDFFDTYITTNQYHAETIFPIYTGFVIPIISPFDSVIILNRNRILNEYSSIDFQSISEPYFILMFLKNGLNVIPKSGLTAKEFYYNNSFCFKTSKDFIKDSDFREFHDFLQLTF